MGCILYSSFIFLVTFLASVSVVHSEADVLLGVRDPVFLAAVDTWLDDSDAVSLPVPSSLANAGNVSARLLLSRIETTDRASSDYINGLSRRGRLDLSRPKSGKSISRPSWL